jgi:hypothetical protein
MGAGGSTAGKGSSSSSMGTSGSASGLENAEHRGSDKGKAMKEKHGKAFHREDRKEKRD